MRHVKPEQDLRLLGGAAPDVGHPDEVEGPLDRVVLRACRLRDLREQLDRVDRGLLLPATPLQDDRRRPDRVAAGGLLVPGVLLGVLGLIEVRPQPHQAGDDLGAEARAHHVAGVRDQLLRAHRGRAHPGGLDEDRVDVAHGHGLPRRDLAHALAGLGEGGLHERLQRRPVERLIRAHRLGGRARHHAGGEHDRDRALVEVAPLGGERGDGAGGLALFLALGVGDPRERDEDDQDEGDGAGGTLESHFSDRRLGVSVSD